MNKPQLIEETIRLKLGQLSPDGALLVDTGKFTGRAAKNRYFTRRAEAEEGIDWGDVNKGLPTETAREFISKVKAHVLGQKFYQTKGFAGVYPIEVTTSSPWHAVFANNMFRENSISNVANSISDRTKIQTYHAPYLKATDLGVSDIPAETIILIDPVSMEIAIAGTAYAGEIKKSAFTLCNYRLPASGILPMHASANCLEDGSESCILFGLSGTGKTTLSAAHDRCLIGDDEIIWTESGISNLEGGCYAKLIDLTERSEPEIFRASNQFGSILENVAFDSNSRKVDFFDSSRTENTRGSYSLEALDNVFDQTKEAKSPKTIVFLTADAFGALPAVAKLDGNQAQYQFISGYTAKVAGTELGVTEPQAAFSACFGAPFMPRHPAVYAKMLAEKAESVGASFWLLNTGWTQGGYGTGKRFPLDVSRTLLRAIQNGELAEVPTTRHPEFGFEVPTRCANVQDKFMEIPNGEEVSKLANRFRKNMEKFESQISETVLVRGGPQRPRAGANPSLVASVGA